MIANQRKSDLKRNPVLLSQVKLLRRQKREAAEVRTRSQLGGHEKPGTLDQACPGGYAKIEVGKFKNEPNFDLK